MNSFIIYTILLILQIVIAKEKEDFCEEELKCIEKLHLNKDHLKQIITDESTKFLPENDVDFNSFQFCHWIARELQDVNGNFNYDKIVECIQDFPRREFGGKNDDLTLISLKIALAATESCKNITKTDNHGQTAVKMQNCIDKHIIELVKKEV
ncbi:hypothetical protein RN001_001670 [Aquatica leii]|uniref:Uncharacterized protein n=1 Tax=Aquatica leii TaxID=1421715 RepID=A0AAN7PG73_9COLE|nr:hypothetical protein RN001_001670 [Aquatica leii]